MDKHDLFSKMKIDPDVFQSFMVAVQNGYTDITYHNQTHGIDVCQTVYYFTTTCEMKEILNIDDTDLTSLIIGTTIHDFEHFGYNNAFLIETQH